ncbi:MAG TPA: ABC transporter permease [Candidatus Binatia bacterium]|nr:ABC transporter permease [Candidatus Binatia bacterium]
MTDLIIGAIIAVVLAWRLSLLFRSSKGQKATSKTHSNRPMSPLQKKFYTVVVFTRLNTRRFFRDRLAIFFGILFPLIFLFVFGGIFGKSGNSVTLDTAVINQSSSHLANQLINSAEKAKVIKIDDTVKNLTAAEAKMARGQLDAAIILPKDFGTMKNHQTYPSGQAEVYYTNNDAQSGQTLVSILQAEFQSLNAKYVPVITPFTAVGKQLTKKSLTEFDYTFSGLVGFSIVGLGIFGPINVFPELKKQGILRRFHTTPIKVWQYFMSMAASQALIGLVSLAIMFFFAITIFNLKVVGDYAEIILFLIFSIVLILGIGLAIGGWAKNERQAAPLGNIIVFPMIFLSGTFFPRYLMPNWLQHVTGFLPLTPVIDGVRLLSTEGQHLTQIGDQLGAMAIWLVVIYFIAFRVFRWE